MRSNTRLPQYLTLSAASLFLAASLILPAQAEGHRQPHATIQTQGTGQSAIAPDMAVLTLGVERSAETAKAALDANTKAMQAVLDALKAEGIANKDLQTSNFSIYPNYRNIKSLNSTGSSNERELIGYNVNNSLTVRVRDITKVGALLDKVVDLGVNSNGNIQFTNENPQAAIDEARKNAVADAIRKAKILAEAAGVKLGKILNIREGGNSRPSPRGLRQVQFKEASAPVPIAAGENSYSVSVNVSWEISQ